MFIADAHAKQTHAYAPSLDTYPYYSN